MRVKLDPDRFYDAFEDPWGIGEADSDRYEVYRRIIRANARGHETMLDIGCGYGAFLARFQGEFGRLVGVDASTVAVEGARTRHPFLELSVADAGRMERSAVSGHYDVIVLSDVIYYLRERRRHALLEWIADHLTPNGIAFIAAWAPGGRYLAVDELRRLVGHHVGIADETLLDTGHAVFVAERRRVLVALTVDHETWQPLPPDRTIDWRADVFEPTERLLQVADRCGAKLTLMAEVAEHAWLSVTDPQQARRFEQQWRDAASRGHDVQLHVHPAWLPGSEVTHIDGGWHWENRWTRLDEHPDPRAVIEDGCRVLRRSVGGVSDTYQVTTFRAGAYEAQPFGPLHDALVFSDVRCDSSVLPGDRREGRAYDYRRAMSDHQPYYANRLDPQLPAPAAERDIVELPVFAWKRGQRWTFDASEGEQFVQRLEPWREPKFGPSTEAVRWWRRLASSRAGTLVRARPGWWPGLQAEPHPLCNRYFVLVGHSKFDLDIDMIERGLRQLLGGAAVESVSLSEMGHIARADLARACSLAEGRGARRSSPTAAREAIGVLDLLPLDRTDALVVRFGPAEPSEHWPASVRRREIDAQQWDGLAELPVSKDDGPVDAVVVMGGLERSQDPRRALGTLRGCLVDGGVVLLSLPLMQPGQWRGADGGWLTTPTELQLRLEEAGFTSVRVREDRERVIASAWVGGASGEQLARVDELLRWAYQTLAPDAPATLRVPLAILAGGVGWCADYTALLGEALHREGYPVRWITMVAEDHPRGRGPRLTEAHAVLELRTAGGHTHVLDPMAGVRFACGIETLIRSPTVADGDRPRDDRYRSRSYDLYATSEWYRRVVALELRDDPNGLPFDLEAERIRHGDAAPWRGGRRNARWLVSAIRAAISRRARSTPDAA